MEGLRGLAVTLVFLVHFAALSEPLIARQAGLLGIVNSAHSLGTAGVDLFFVLSGFLIYGSLMRKPQPFGTYLLRRIQRIYPVFALVFALYLILSVYFPQESRIPLQRTAAYLYVLENFFLLPGMFPIVPIITVAWSLSYEFFFYLAIPLLIWALRLREWPRNARILFLVAGGGLILAWPQIVGDHIRLAMFIAGMLTTELRDAAGKAPSPQFAGWIGLAIALLGHHFIGLSDSPHVGQWQFLALFIGFFLLCTDCFRRGGTAALFSWTPLRWLGNMSYSYYLLHGLTLKFAFWAIYRLIRPDGTQTGLFAAALLLGFGATLLSSATLFVLVERPYSLMPIGTRRTA